VGSLYVFSQTARTVKARLADGAGDKVEHSARIGSQFEVVGADMSLEGLVFAESLVAGWVRCASKSLMAFVSCFVTFQSSSCQEALCAAREIAGVGAFMLVRAFDVLREVLLLHVRLIASFISAYKWSFIRM